VYGLGQSGCGAGIGDGGWSFVSRAVVQRYEVCLVVGILVPGCIALDGCVRVESGEVRRIVRDGG
jgi:hypothetical protein